MVFRAVTVDRGTRMAVDRPDLVPAVHIGIHRPGPVLPAVGTQRVLIHLPGQQQQPITVSPPRPFTLAAYDETRRQAPRFRGAES